MATTNGRTGVAKRPTPPSVNRVNSGEKQWRVQRTIPAAEPVDVGGATQSERERELVSIVKNLQKQITSLKSQVSRIQRFDGKGAKMSDHQALQAVVQSNLALSEQLRQLLRQRQEEEVDPLMNAVLETQSIHREQQRERTAEVARNVAYTNRLTRAEQVINPSCPCGEHKGLMFIEGDVILEDNLCPRDWWFMMSNHAFYYGQLGAFLRDNPFKEYLKQYRV